MARKTFNVEAFKARVNTLLAAPASGSVPRSTAASLLESVLMDTGNYHGFRYLPSEYSNELEFATTGKVLRDGYDNTRRYYF